jgi:hypothetical protein
MTQIGGNKEEDEDKNRVYNRKNTDLDSRLQIWLLFGPELVEKQTNAKVTKMTQTTAKYQNKMIV